MPSLRTPTERQVPPTSTDLREKLDNARKQANESANAASRASDHYRRLRSLRLDDRASDAEVADAGALFKQAQDLADDQKGLIAIYEEELRKAEEEERQQRLTELGQRAADAVKQRSAAAKRLERALNTTRSALAAFDDALATTRAVRNEVADLRDLEGSIKAIERRWREKYEEMARSAPPGQVPNEASLERRMENEIEALRQAIADEAAQLAPDADAAALSEVVDAFSDLPPRLLDSATRQAIADGDEFVSRVKHINELPAVSRGATGRYYSDFEMPEAEARHEQFLGALRRLAGPPAKHIGVDEHARVVHVA